VNLACEFGLIEQLHAISFFSIKILRFSFLKLKP